MLNFPTPDPEDHELLEDSYKMIGRKTSLAIINDREEVDTVCKMIVNSISLPDNCHFTIANLFKITGITGYFYIAQTLQDFGYSQTGQQAIRDEYRYQVIGMAKLNADFGTIIVRPNIWADRVVGRFFKPHIIVPNADLFNSKYHVTAEDPKNALKVLDTRTARAISPLEGLNLHVQKEHVFLWFESTMTEEHSSRIEEVLLTIECLDA